MDPNTTQSTQSDTPPTQPIPSFPTTPNPSPDKHTALVILFLVFIYPIGFVLMWILMKRWRFWLKFTLSLPIILLLLILIGGTLVRIISPKTIQNRQAILQANSDKRVKDIGDISYYISKYIKDQQSVPPIITQYAQTKISKKGTDICSVLVPKYIGSLPEDPSINSGNPITNCDVDYDTGYLIYYYKPNTLTYEGAYVSIVSSEAGDAKIIVSDYLPR